MDEPLVYKFSVSSPVFNSRLTHLSLPPPESEVDSKGPGTRLDFYTPWFFEQATIKAEHVEDYEVDNENQLVITSGEAVENTSSSSTPDRAALSATVGSVDAELDKQGQVTSRSTPRTPAKINKRLQPTITSRPAKDVTNPSSSSTPERAAPSVIIGNEGTQFGRQGRDIQVASRSTRSTRRTPARINERLDQPAVASGKPALQHPSSSSASDRAEPSATIRNTDEQLGRQGQDIQITSRSTERAPTRIQQTEAEAVLLVERIRVSQRICREKVAWFSSTTSQPIPFPPSIGHFSELAEHDIFLCWVGEDLFSRKCNAWIYLKKSWKPLSWGHSIAAGYFFIISNTGQPNFVTEGTWKKYYKNQSRLITVEQ